MPEKLGLATKRKRQRTLRRATLPASMADPDAARVPARSLFGSVHVPSASRAPQPQRRLANIAAAATTHRDGLRGTDRR